MDGRRSRATYACILDHAAAGKEGGHHCQNAQEWLSGHADSMLTAQRLRHASYGTMVPSLAKANHGGG